MRLVVIGAIVLLLTSCASTPRSAVSTPALSPAATGASPESESTYLALRDAAKDIRDRLIFACTGVNPSNGTSLQMPPMWTYSEDPEICYREKLAMAFGDPDGAANCASEPGLGSYVLCLGYGGYLNRLRQNVGSPKLLSPAEWHDSTAAVVNTLAEIQAQALVQCATKSGDEMAACHQEVEITAFGVPPDEADSCRHTDLYKCLADKAALQFMQDRALTAW